MFLSKNASAVLCSFALFYFCLQADTSAWVSSGDRLFQEVLASQPRPSLKVKQKLTGQVLELALESENFKFSEACSSPNDEEFVGHAHIYVDGKKVSSTYEAQAVVVLESPGVHQIVVTLNTLPEHRFLRIDGEVIQQVFDVEVL